MRRLLIMAAALAVSACATIPATVPPVDTPTPAPTSTPAAPVDAAAPPASTVDKAADAVARADVAVERAYTAWLAIKHTADLVTPFLSPTRAANIRLIEAVVDNAFARARTATDLAVRAAELAKAAKAAAQLQDLVIDPD